MMQQRTTTIAFIGGGNMARAMLAGLLRAGHEPGALRAADPAAGQRERLGELHESLRVLAANADAAQGADVVVFAVKPQVLPEVARSLSVQPAQLAVSVAAGVTLASLRDWLGADVPCVRVMPNQPALVGAGMSVLCASPSVSPAQRDQAEYLARAAGAAAWVRDESLMDAVTAISGSGPAYFYLLMEILEDEARRLGIDAPVARQLAVQTACGAGLAARDTAASPGDLRRTVTSPGGTTQAALQVLEQGKLRELFASAVEAARLRSVELGQGDDT
jgi:pyrroline-5-carboxylate reductase